MDRFFSAIVTVVLMMFMASGCGADKAGSGTPMDNARELFSRHDYRLAADAYQQAVADDPDSVEAWSGLAEASVQLGDTQRAVDANRQVIRIDPGHVKALLSLARFDMLAGDLTPAEEKTLQALQSQPENTEALFLMADVYSRTKRFRQAEETYQKLLPLVSDKTRVLTGLALIQARSGDLASALASLEKAVADAPGAMEPRLMLFNYYYGRGDYAGAEMVLMQAIAANPLNSNLKILLGKYYFSRKQTDQAEKAFSDAVRNDPGNESVYLVAGKFYSAVNKPEEALKMFQKAGQIQPRDVNVMTLLAEFYLDNKYLTEAAQTVAGILDKNPAYFPARLLKIRTLIAQQEYDQAISLCDAYLQGNPAADQLLVLKGMAHIEKGELEQAEQVLARAVDVAPANINAKFRLLDVYQKRGKIEQSQQLNRNIFSYLHKNFDVTMVLGDTDLHKEITPKGLDSLDSLSRFASINPFDRFRAEHLDSLRAEYDRLMSGFNQMIEKNPGLIGIFENIILLHAVRKEFDVALARCDQQIERLKADSLNTARVHNIKGGLYLAQNNIAQAKSSYEQAIRMAPELLKPYYGLARVYIINKDVDNAITQYRTLLTRDSQQASPHLLLGVLYKMKGDFQAAEEAYRRALAIDPNLAQAANNLAYLMADQDRNLDEALNLALQSKSFKGEDPYVQDTLGWVYYKKKLYDDAVRELSLSVERLPDSALVNYHLGMAYHRKGDAARARLYLEKALNSGDNLNEADSVRKILADM